MSTRKIAECVNLRINLGNFQHLEFVKYAEEQVEYSSAEELDKKEDSIRNDLIENIMRTLKDVPAMIGKGASEAQQVEQAIKNKIPEWLSNGPTPNIANYAVKKEIQIAASQQETKDVVNRVFDVKDVKSVEKVPEKVNEQSPKKVVSDDDLFEETNTKKANIEEAQKIIKEADKVIKETEKVLQGSPKKEEDKDDIFNFDFDDEKK